jgi:chromosome segregation ATPase
MDTTTVSTAQIQEDIDRLRIQFPRTSDLYREVCVLLFFRYGITPTANKLYQYVRKGSMSAPAEALNHFWLQLRDKSRVRIEYPDLPTELTEAAGEFIGMLWHQARESAQGNYNQQIAQASEQIDQAMLEVLKEREIRSSTESELEVLKRKLENTLKQLSTIEKKEAVNISALAQQENALKTLQNKCDTLEQQIEGCRLSFSADLEKVNVSLALAEERYRALETKSLLAIDRERQAGKEKEKENVSLRSALLAKDRLHAKKFGNNEKLTSRLKEQLAMIRGQLKASKQYQTNLVKEIRTLQKRLTNKSLLSQAVDLTKNPEVNV